MSENNGLIEKGCGCWLFVTISSFFVLFIVYIFSNGSIDVVKKHKIGDLYQSKLSAHFDRKLNKDVELIDALEENRLITNIKFEIIKLSNYIIDDKEKKVIEKLDILFNKHSNNINELDKYLEVVSMSFDNNKNEKINAKFLTIKGKYFALLTEEGRKISKPWAQYLDMIDFNKNSINK